MFEQKVIKYFNEKEMRIYEFITKNSSKIPYMTIRELASEISVSTTTILNFVRKAGYQNYSTFKYSYKIKEEMEIQKNAKHDFKEIIECLEKFDSDIYKQRFKMANDILKENNKIIFIGIGNSGMTAQYGARLFSSMGKFSFAIDDPYLRIGKLEEGCTVIVLSISGETPEIIDKVEVVKTFGCKVIAITTTENNTLSRMADVTIPSYIESVYEHNTDFTTQIPSIGVIEVLSRMLLK